MVPHGKLFVLYLCETGSLFVRFILVIRKLPNGHPLKLYLTCQHSSDGLFPVLTSIESNIANHWPREALLHPQVQPKINTSKCSFACAYFVKVHVMVQTM